MGLVTLKMILGIMAVIGGLLLILGIERGLVKWERDTYDCASGRGFYNEVDRQLLIRIGKNFKIYHQPLTWGCAEEYRYDPKTHHVEGTSIVPN